MLPHKIFRRVQRVQTADCERRGERRVGMRTGLSEAAQQRTESKVRAAGGHGVRAIDHHLVKAVGALGVGDRQTILRAGHSNGHAFNWISIRVEDPAGDIAGQGRGQITSQGKIA